MSRHNRRRTRGGRKHSGGARSHSPESHLGQNHFEDAAIAANTVPTLIPAFVQAMPVGGHGLVFGSTDVIPRGPATPQRAPLNRSSALSARVWHNRYLAWQNRDRKQREEMERLETERARIFGGTTSLGGGGCSDDGSGSEEDEDEDMDGLEEKMLEYFGGLEWLDT